jgi:hypothetical protein
MTQIENEILRALNDLDQTIKSFSTGQPKPSLLPIFNRIDSLSEKLPRDTDPSLLHYLKKKSYEKARIFLQGRDAENTPGPCGHV